jgi:hypothetical protein
MSSKFLKSIAIALLITWIAPQAQAQCPMCRMSVESNLKNGGSAGKGLNNGILYMLSLPYVLVGTIGYVWWKNRKKETGEAAD